MVSNSEFLSKNGLWMAGGAATGGLVLLEKITSGTGFEQIMVIAPQTALLVLFLLWLNHSTKQAAIREKEQREFEAVEAEKRRRHESEERQRDRESSQEILNRIFRMIERQQEAFENRLAKLEGLAQNIK